MVAAPWRRSRSRRGMERRRLLGGMALLLLQALPSPLSAGAEPPQVRGRGRPGQAVGLGVIEAWQEGAGDDLAASWRELRECCCQELRGPERDPQAWRGQDLRGRRCLAEGHLFWFQGGWQRHGAKRVRAFETAVRSGGLG